jgi:D-arabinose 1-dehydrogenase-like Zn-dependent alcohol dehydrogenase
MSLLMEITAAVPLTAAQMTVVNSMVNAGATATALIAFLGGGGLVGFIVHQAFKNGAKKVIIAA